MQAANRKLDFQVQNQTFIPFIPSTFAIQFSKLQKIGYYCLKPYEVYSKHNEEETKGPFRKLRPSEQPTVVII